MWPRDQQKFQIFWYFMNLEFHAGEDNILESQFWALIGLVKNSVVIRQKGPNKPIQLVGLRPWSGYSLERLKKSLSFDFQSSAGLVTLKKTKLLIYDNQLYILPTFTQSVSQRPNSDKGLEYFFSMFVGCLSFLNFVSLIKRNHGIN
jgi:hypothetical protein